MKNLFAVICALLLLQSVVLPGYAGPGRPSFSSRPSYSGGFRSSSSSSYRSFSSSPSRSFSFRSSPSMSSYARPAATAPRSYSYSIPKATIATPVSRSTTKRTVINNHYHGDAGHSGGGGGLSLMDVVALNALTSHNNSPTYVTTQPVAAGPAYAQPVAAADYQDGPAVIYQREESHFWRNFFLAVLGIVILTGIVAAGVHFYELGEAEKK